jgi:disulfide bond formation protein DsbB
MMASLVAALGFEHLGGFRPCPLCLMQRWAYYAGMPVLFFALVLLKAERPRPAAVLFALVSLAFLANAGLGIYHAGAEWAFWPGPDTCAAPAGGATSNAADLLKRLAQGADVIRCDRAPWRLFGLSFAGWNVVVSLFVSAGAGRAIFNR